MEYRGHAVRYLPDWDTDRLTRARANEAFGALWYGNEHPTLIVSSMAIKEVAMREVIAGGIVPVSRDGRSGFRWNSADWIDSEDITDGKIFLLNENQKREEKFNGWFRVDGRDIGLNEHKRLWGDWHNPWVYEKWEGL